MITEINNYDEFKIEVLESSVPVLVDFYATWCGPCKMLGLQLMAITSEQAGDVKIVKVDIDKVREARDLFEIMSVPTMLLMKNGEVVDRNSGFLVKGDIIGFMKQ